MNNTKKVPQKILMNVPTLNVEHNKNKEECCNKVTSQPIISIQEPQPTEENHVKKEQPEIIQTVDLIEKLSQGHIKITNKKIKVLNIQDSKNDNLKQSHRSSPSLNSITKRDSTTKMSPNKIDDPILNTTEGKKSISNSVDEIKQEIRKIEVNKEKLGHVVKIGNKNIKIIKMQNCKIICDKNDKLKLSHSSSPASNSITKSVSTTKISEVKIENPILNLPTEKKSICYNNPVVGILYPIHYNPNVSIQAAPTISEKTNMNISQPISKTVIKNEKLGHDITIHNNEMCKIVKTQKPEDKNSITCENSIVGIPHQIPLISNTLPTFQNNVFTTVALTSEISGASSFPTVTLQNKGKDPNDHLNASLKSVKSEPMDTKPHKTVNTQNSEGNNSVSSENPQVGLPYKTDSLPKFPNNLFTTVNIKSEIKGTESNPMVTLENIRKILNDPVNAALNSITKNESMDTNQTVKLEKSDNQPNCDSKKSVKKLSNPDNKQLSNDSGRPRTDPPPPLKSCTGHDGLVKLEDEYAVKLGDKFASVGEFRYYVNSHASRWLTAYKNVYSYSKNVANGIARYAFTCSFLLMPPSNYKKRGLRKRKESFQTICPSRITLRRMPGEEEFTVAYVCHHHTHPLCKELFYRSAQFKRLPPDFKEEIYDLMALELDRPIIRKYILETTGFDLTLRQIYTESVAVKQKEKGQRQFTSDKLKVLLEKIRTLRELYGAKEINQKDKSKDGDKQAPCTPAAQKDTNHTPKKPRQRKRSKIDNPLSSSKEPSATKRKRQKKVDNDGEAEAESPNAVTEPRKKTTRKRRRETTAGNTNKRSRLQERLEKISYDEEVMQSVKQLQESVRCSYEMEPLLPRKGKANQKTAAINKLKGTPNVSKSDDIKRELTDHCDTVIQAKVYQTDNLVVNDIQNDIEYASEEQIGHFVEEICVISEEQIDDITEYASVEDHDGQPIENYGEQSIETHDYQLDENVIEQSIGGHYIIYDDQQIEYEDDQQIEYEDDQQIVYYYDYQEVENHDQEIESNIQEVESQDRETNIHDQDIESHDREIENQDQGIGITYQEIECHGQEIESHDQDIQSQIQEFESHIHDIESHDQEIEIHDHETESNGQGNESQDQEIGSNYQEIEYHDQEIESHGQDIKIQIQEIEINNQEIGIHDQEIKGNDKKIEIAVKSDAMEADTKTIVIYNEESYKNAWLKNTENNNIFCEPSTKPAMETAKIERGTQSIGVQTEQIKLNMDCLVNESCGESDIVYNNGITYVDGDEQVLMVEYISKYNIHEYMKKDEFPGYIQELAKNLGVDIVKLLSMVYNDSAIKVVSNYTKDKSKPEGNIKLELLSSAVPDRVKDPALTEIEKYKAEISTYFTTFKVVNQRLEDYVQHIKTLTNRLDNSVKINNKLHENNIKLTSMNEYYQQKINSLKAQFEVKDKEMFKIAKQNEIYQRDICTLITECDKLTLVSISTEKFKSDIVTLTKRLLKLNNDLEEQKDMNNKILKNVRLKELNKIYLRINLMKAKTRIKGLRAKLNRYRIKYNKLVDKTVKELIKQNSKGDKEFMRSRNKEAINKCTLEQNEETRIGDHFTTKVNSVINVVTYMRDVLKRMATPSCNNSLELLESIQCLEEKTNIMCSQLRKMLICNVGLAKSPKETILVSDERDTSTQIPDTITDNRISVDNTVNIENDITRIDNQEIIFVNDHSDNEEMYVNQNSVQDLPIVDKRIKENNKFKDESARSHSTRKLRVKNIKSLIDRKPCHAGLREGVLKDSSSFADYLQKPTTGEMSDIQAIAANSSLLEDFDIPCIKQYESCERHKDKYREDDMIVSLGSKFRSKDHFTKQLKTKGKLWFSEYMKLKPSDPGRKDKLYTFQCSKQSLRSRQCPCKAVLLESPNTKDLTVVHICNHHNHEWSSHEETLCTSEKCVCLV